MFSSRKIILYVILLIAICVSAYILLVVIPSRMAEQTYNGARKIGQDIREAFQFTPEVKVNNTVVLQQQTEIFELATLSQKFRHEYTWTNTWMGSTKRIMIKGTFEAKAGFNLNENFKIDVHDDKAIVTLPRPKLLSLTPQDDISFTDENGIWNWVNPNDRSAAINAFTKDATRYARDAMFVQKASEMMEDKLTEILSRHGKAVEIRYEGELKIERND